MPWPLLDGPDDDADRLHGRAVPSLCRLRGQCRVDVLTGHPMRRSSWIESLLMLRLDSYLWGNFSYLWGNCQFWNLPT